MSRTIQPYESISDFVDEHGRTKFKADEDVVASLRGLLRDLQSYAENLKISAVELLLLINRTFGFVWKTIPYGQFSVIKEWVRNNHHRSYQILEPEKHNALMTDDTIPNVNYYRNWFNSNGDSKKQPRLDF